MLVLIDKQGYGKQPWQAEAFHEVLMVRGQKKKEALDKVTFNEQTNQVIKGKNPQKYFEGFEADLVILF